MKLPGIFLILVFAAMLFGGCAQGKTGDQCNQEEISYNVVEQKACDGIQDCTCVLRENGTCSKCSCEMTNYVCGEPAESDE